MRPKLKLVLVVLGIVAGTVLLDRFVYDWAIFQPRNRSGWDAFRWYNFEYHSRQIRERQDANAGAHSPRPFVLFLGSSVARYSFNRTALRKELTERYPGNRAPDFNILTHASLLPLDAYYYVPRIRRANPDLVVYVMNPADLDLERYTPPWEAGPDYSETAAGNYMLIRRPLQMYYPGAFAADRGDLLDWKRSLRLHLRSALWSMRMKDDWFDPLYFNLRSQRSQLRSYLNYQGLPRPYGVWRDGVSGACFSLSRSETASTPGKLLLQIRKELTRGGNFHLHFFTYTGSGETSRADSFAARSPGAGKRTAKQILCSTPKGARRAGVHSPKRAGWRRIPWSWDKAPREHNRLFILLSHVENKGKRISVTAGTPVQAGRGVRLPGNPGMNTPPLQDYLQRRRTLKDETLLFTADSVQAREFQERIHPADWQEPHRIALRQLNFLRLAKYYVNWYDFSETFQVRELGKFAARLRRESPRTKLLIINNPENPLTLNAYGRSAWYRGYLAHMRKLAARHSGVEFLDLHDRGRPADFSDAHHLTYDGSARFSPLYADAIKKALAQTAKKRDAK